MKAAKRKTKLSEEALTKRAEAVAAASAAYKCTSCFNRDARPGMVQCEECGMSNVRSVTRSRENADEDTCIECLSRPRARDEDGELLIISRGPKAGQPVTRCEVCLERQRIAAAERYAARKEQ